MIDLIFAIVAMAAAANPPSGQSAQSRESTAQVQAPASRSVVIGSDVQVGADVMIEGGPADVFAAPAGLVAEQQTPSGKFTTATEVKPILTVTKGSWVAVRVYGGNDLLYFTHLWSWRCGLGAMAVSVNDGPVQNVPLPDCHTGYATPNAILEQDGLPYLTYPPQSINSVTVHIIYDDLTRDSATFGRSDVAIP